MDRFASLALFAAAVDEGSLAAAGRRFKLSAAVAGKHVGALESTLGVRLLHRTTRRLSLTEAGQAFLPRCRRILAEFEEAEREAGDGQHLVTGTLRVAAPNEFAVARLGDVVARYVTDHPAVHVNLWLDDRYTDLVANEIDVAIRIGRLVDPNLVIRKLGSCRMMFCASPAFVDRHGAPRSPTELASLSRLVFSQSVSPDDWSVVAPDGTTCAVGGPSAASANNVQLLAEVAAAGAGVAYGPDFVFEAKIASGQLVRVLETCETPTLDIQAVYPAFRFIPRKVKCFVDVLADAIGDARG
jgi:DNA-binding transcriptional LysR family regulator